MASQVLQQTVLFSLGLLFLVQGRRSQGCPGTVVTYITAPPSVGQLLAYPLIPLGRHKTLDAA